MGLHTNSVSRREDWIIMIIINIIYNTISVHVIYNIIFGYGRKFILIEFTAVPTENNFTMMTPSNGNIFRVTGHLCGEFTGPRWIPRTKASDAELWSFLWSASDKRLSKQSRGWWFETPCRSLWRQRNANHSRWSYCVTYANIFASNSFRQITITRSATLNQENIWHFQGP